jgi:hypothetical protein
LPAKLLDGEKMETQMTCVCLLLMHYLLARRVRKRQCSSQSCVPTSSQERLAIGWGVPANEGPCYSHLAGGVDAPGSNMGIGAPFPDQLINPRLIRSIREEPPRHKTAIGRPRRSYTAQGTMRHQISAAG